MSRNKYYSEAYRKSNYTSLKDVYKKPSKTKREIEFDIKYRCVKERGFDFRILSYNIYMFTCAYLVTDENGVLYLHVFTPTKDFYIEYLIFPGNSRIYIFL